MDMQVWEDPFQKVKQVKIRKPGTQEPGDWPPYPYHEPNLFERVVEHTLAELASHTIQAVVQTVQVKLSERSSLAERIKELESKVDYLLNDLEYVDAKGEAIDVPDIAPQTKTKSTPKPKPKAAS